MAAISTALKRLGAKRMGWWLNKEWFIAEGEGLRRLNMRSAEDRAAIRDAVRHMKGTAKKNGRRYRKRRAR